MWYSLFLAFLASGFLERYSISYSRFFSFFCASVRCLRLARPEQTRLQNTLRPSLLDRPT